MNLSVIDIVNTSLKKKKKKNQCNRYSGVSPNRTILHTFVPTKLTWENKKCTCHSNSWWIWLKYQSPTRWNAIILTGLRCQVAKKKNRSEQQPHFNVFPFVNDSNWEMINCVIAISLSLSANQTRYFCCIFYVCPSSAVVSFFQLSFCIFLSLSLSLSFSLSFFLSFFLLTSCSSMLSSTDAKDFGERHSFHCAL